MIRFTIVPDDFVDPGAYFMRPVGNATTPVADSASLTLVTGPVVSEARQVNHVLSDGDLHPSQALSNLAGLWSLGEPGVSLVGWRARCTAPV